MALGVVLSGQGGDKDGQTSCGCGLCCGKAWVWYFVLMGAFFEGHPLGDTA